MSTVMSSILTVCLVLIATELLRKLCPEDRMVQFVAGLIALGMLLSLVGSLLSLDVDFSFSEKQAQRQQEDLTSYVGDQLEQALQRDAQEYVEGLLAAGGLQAKEIRVLTDRNEGGSIVLTEVAAVFAYPSDGERARVLLQNVLGEEVRVNVEVEP